MDDRTLALCARDLAVKVAEKTLLNNVALDLHAGQAMALIGPNGAGKTTFLETCVGLKTPHTGSLSVCGLDPPSQRNRLRARVGMYLQPGLLPNAMTVWEAVKLFRVFYDESIHEARDALDLMGLLPFRDKRCGVLSAGERQRLMISLSLIGSPDLLIMDEPTSSLDPEWRQRFYELLPTLCERGAAVLIATHQTDRMEDFFTCYAVMNDGTIVYAGEIGQLVALNREWPIDISLTVGTSEDLRRLLEPLAELKLVSQKKGTLHLRARDPGRAIAELGSLLAAQNVLISSFWLRDSSKPNARRYMQFGARN